ncbi:hypothetical protein LTR60_002345, partial [Cryomyces antarcticus]
MRRYEAGTPCPAQSLDLRSSIIYDHHLDMTIQTPYPQDETANIEYTRAIRAEFKNARPRRPRVASRNSRKTAWDPMTEIHEDRLEESRRQEKQEEGQIDSTRTHTAGGTLMPTDGQATRRSTMLEQPVQKLPCFAPIVEDAKSARPPTMRVSTMSVARECSFSNNTGINKTCGHDSQEEENYIQKNPRRRTIYIPSEDTTIMTIHPGAPTHGCRNVKPRLSCVGLALLSLPEAEVDHSVSKPAHKRAPRQSLAAAPKRAPLQQRSRPTQETSIVRAVRGQGNGKENVPPGKTLYPEQKSKCKDLQSREEKPHGSPRTRFAATEPTAASLSRVAGNGKRIISDPKEGVTRAKMLRAGVGSKTSIHLPSSVALLKVLEHDLTKQQPSFRHISRPPLEVVRRRRPERVPYKLGVPQIVLPTDAHLDKYPVLTENLAHPELYEDNWLGHQEIAITQLVNSLYDAGGSGSRVLVRGEADIRRRLLELYNDPAVQILFKRLQASLLYGALSIPKDLLSHASRLQDDVGLRRRFLNLFLDTYNLSTLQAAIEVVVGRKIPQCARPCRSSTSMTGERRHRAGRKALDDFFNTFLVRNEDAIRPHFGTETKYTPGRRQCQPEDFGSHGWTWRRTVLRSLMLIFLLDKSMSSNVLPGPLFQASSAYKSSSAVLQALTAMLLPSVGDVTRHLGRLDYIATHAQYPLQEYAYHITNLATDLRDGVLLTRLVELLLYPPSALAAQSDNTITVSMPTGHALISALDVNEEIPT